MAERKFVGNADKNLCKIVWYGYVVHGDDADFGVRVVLDEALEAHFDVQGDGFGVSGVVHGQVEVVDCAGVGGECFDFFWAEDGYGVAVGEGEVEGDAVEVVAGNFEVDGVFDYTQSGQEK